MSREEVAQRAEVSVSWYKLIELGRANRPSRAMLERVADALELTSFERGLALKPAVGIVRDPTRDLRIGESLRQVLDQAQPYPAYVCNARWDVLAWNRPTCNVYTDLDALALRERNVLRILFRDSVMRNRMRGWEASARRAVATFRAARMSFSESSWFDEVIADLHVGNLEFRSWWDRYEVRQCAESHDHLDHPAVGRLVLDTTPLLLAYDPSLFLVLVSPDPRTDSRARLAKLQPRLAEAGKSHATPP